MADPRSIVPRPRFTSSLNKDITVSVEQELASVGDDLEQRSLNILRSMYLAPSAAPGGPREMGGRGAWSGWGGGSVADGQMVNPGVC